MTRSSSALDDRPLRCTRSLTRRLLRRGDIPVLVASDPPRLHLPRGAAERGGGLGRGWRRARAERAAT